MRLHRWWGFVLFCFLSTWYKLDDVVWRGCFPLTTRLSSTGGVTRAEVQNRGILNCSACRGEISLEMGGEERKIRTSWKLAECGKCCMVVGTPGCSGNWEEFGDGISSCSEVWVYLTYDRHLFQTGRDLSGGEFILLARNLGFEPHKQDKWHFIFLSLILKYFIYLLECMYF